MNSIGTVSKNNGPAQSINDISVIANREYLFNAGKTTNFTFVVNGHQFSNAEIESVNAINTRCKFIDRVAAIQNMGAYLNSGKWTM